MGQGLLVVRLSNFVYFVPINQTPVNRTVRLAKNCMSPANKCPVNGNGVYMYESLESRMFKTNLDLDINLIKPT